MSHPSRLILRVQEFCLNISERSNIWSKHLYFCDNWPLKTPIFSFFATTTPLNAIFKIRGLMTNQDLINQLVKLLAMAENEIVTGGVIEIDGISLIDIAEGCTGALQIMSRDPNTRERIRSENIIPAGTGFIKFKFM
jgi:hypothetical protein